MTKNSNPIENARRTRPARRILPGFAASASLVAVLGATTASGSSPSPISTVAGNGTGGFLGDYLPGTSAQVNEPRSVATLGDGSLLIADRANNRIRRLSSGVITTVAGNGPGAFAGDGLPPALASLKEPSAVAPIASGGFLIADSGNHRIRKVDGGTITTVAGDGSGANGADNVAATASALKEPEDVSATADGGYLVADTGNHKIRKVSSTGVIRTVAGTGSGGQGGDGGSATSAQLSEPAGVAALSDGGFLIADTGNDRIRRVSPAGMIATVAGKSSSGFDGDLKPATSAKLDEPGDVAPVASGGFVISDTKNSRIRFVDPVGTISTIAGSGTSGFNGDGIPATSAQLGEPMGIAVTLDGAVQVADTANHRIRRFVAALSVSALGGSDSDDDKKEKEKDKPETKLPKPTAPVAGVRVNLALVRGVVKVKRPGARAFAKLPGAASVPVGSLIDTRNGAARLTSAADLRGSRQTAVFHSGTFKLRQRRTRRPVTELVLRGGDFGSCASRSARMPLAGASRNSSRRGLWGRGRGRFRTRGRSGVATVRGTIWFTQDRCDGTFVRVRRGVVAVRDFANRRTVRVRAGRSYLARHVKAGRRRG